MAWCEFHGVHYVFGLARNPRLEAFIADQLAEAEAKAKDSGKPERLFKELRYQTLNSWSRERRVVAKAEHLPKGKNPRFIVTSLTPEKLKAQELYDTIYRARGEMENRINECQLYLFAHLTSTASLSANQLRLWFASLSYVLFTALRLIALQNGTCESHSLNHPAQTPEAWSARDVSVRRIKIAIAPACPMKRVFANAHRDYVPPPELSTMPVPPSKRHCRGSSAPRHTGAKPCLSKQVRSHASHGTKTPSQRW